MTNSPPLNPFMSVRPRGPDMPSATPKGHKTGARPPRLAGSGDVKALDRNGRRTVGMAPRTTGAIAIENREQGAASTQKRAAIRRGMSQ